MSPTKQIIRREGEYWTVVFDGVVIRLRDSRGLRYLAPLLRQPGRKIPAIELVAVTSSADPSERRQKGSPRPAANASARDRDAERARLTVTKGIKNLLERIADVHPALAAHLQSTVRRGYVCSYAPDPRYPTAWEE